MNSSTPSDRVNQTVDKAYDLLATEDDGRACKDIPDIACHYLPGNYLLLLLSKMLSALADLLTNPKTVLTWLLSALGSPAAFIAWLVPIRESGSMLPQLLIGAWVRRFVIRKHFVVAGSLIQAASLAAMAVVALMLSGSMAGLTIILLLVVFSLGRGLNSVAMKDVMGKTIPKGRRGRLGGVATSVSGVMTAAVSLWLLQQDGSDSTHYAALLFAGAVLWLIAAVLMQAVHEHAGETSGGVDAIQAAKENLRLLRDDSTLRNFIICRGLLLSSALVQPFVVMLAQQQNSSMQTLGLLLLASSVAGAVSASLWGRLADSNSRQVLLIAALLTTLGCLAPVLLQSASITKTLWFFPLLFVWLNIAHAGVRLGRKTYLIDIATGNKRTDYVAVSNSLIGLLLLFAGAIAAAIATWSVLAVLVFFAVCSAAAAIVAQRLPPS